MRLRLIVILVLAMGIFLLGSCSDGDDPLRFVRASGFVRDDAGMPVEDAVVTIQEWDGDEYLNREAQTASVTGAFNIRYEIMSSQSTLGPVRVSAIAPGFMEGIVDLQLGENNGITVTLDPQP